MEGIGMSFEVLIVDDEESLRGVLTQVLEEDGFVVSEAASAEEALDIFSRTHPPIVFTDIRMGGMSGLQLLHEIKQSRPETQVIIITSNASLDSAITAIRAGAYDFLVKPFEDLSLISAVAERASEKFYLMRENQALINKLKEKNQELEISNRSSLRKLQAAFEQSSNSIIIADTHGSIEYVNPHFCRTSGYSTDEVTGKSIRLLGREDGADEKGPGPWETVLNGGSWSGELLRRKKNGEPYWENSNIAPIVNEDGVIANLIAINEDITERKLAEIELRAAKEAAEASNLAKSQFLANMSHEIRTPMHGVLGMLSMLLKSGMDEAQIRLACMAQSSAEKLLEVINGILDFSKIEAGRLELQPSDFSLHSMVKDITELFMVHARNKGIGLRYEFQGTVPDALVGDVNRLRQILINLIGNAIKFTESGEASVCIRLSEETIDYTVLQFEVKDTGPGIAEDTLHYIFDPFRQADDSMSRRHEGTGLGLTISKQLVEMMQGDIGVESEPGKGSRFWFTVRLKRARVAPGNEVSNERDETSVGDGPIALHLRVLLAEDNPMNQEVGKLILEYLGCNVDVVADGALAVEAFFAEAYDLVFMDCQMPVVDGYEATRMIRKRELQSGEGRQRIPVVALTGNAMDGARELCLSAGMDDYLSKPFNAAQIETILKRWVLVEAET